MKSYVLFIFLIIGIALGVAVAVYGPGYMNAFIPKAKSAKGGISGEVAAKSLEQDRLLITLNAPEGAILVTFRKKIPEINLLVEEGDTINLNIKEYKPFVDDPGINMVKKPERKKEESSQVKPTETGKPPAEEEQPPVEELKIPVLNSTP